MSDYVLISTSQYSFKILEIFLSSFEQFNVLDRVLNAFIVFDLERPKTLRSVHRMTVPCMNIVLEKIRIILWH